MKKVSNKYFSLLFLMFFLSLNTVQADEVGLCIGTKECSNISFNYFNVIFVSILFLLIIMFLLAIFNLKKQKNISKNGIVDKDIKKVDSNLTSLAIKEEAFSLYKKFETAKTKQNYDLLKEILSEEFYLEQEEVLKKMKERKEKIVATNINMKDVKILSIGKEKDLVKVVVYLYVSQYDYVLNKKKQVIRGTEEDLYQIEYKLTLIKDLNKHFIIKKMQCLGKWIKN